MGVLVAEDDLVRELLGTMVCRLAHGADRPPSGGGPWLALFDVDDLEAYNDHYGHAAGDVALGAVARVLDRGAPLDGAVLRLGGDRFLVVIPGHGSHEAVRVADALRRDVEGLAIPHDRGPVPGILTTGVGLALYDPDLGLDAALRAAGLALGTARRAGPGRMGIDDPTLDGPGRRPHDGLMAVGS